jgi:AcrR family transcriptional regulator
MVRPSQNIDQLLLDAGLALLPSTGCAGFSVRKLAQHAGVNLGMFHYHFKTKDNFIRAVLQRTYEEMFSALSLRVNPARAPLDNLRDALGVLGQFASKNRHLLVRILADAMSGEALAADFLKANLPRHIGVIASLIGQAQKEGSLVQAPVSQLIAFMAGCVAAPVLIGTAAGSSMAESVGRQLISPEAIAQRIDFALRGLAIPTETKKTEEIKETP